MKKIEWKVVIIDGKVASLETAKGFSLDQIESHFEIIGILENLKLKHTERLKTLFSQTIKKDNNNGDEKNEVDL